MSNNNTVTRRALLAAGAAAVGGLALYGCGPSAGAIPITVFKDAGCGCCKLWVAKLEAEGFTATVEDRAELGDLKQQLGVPDDLTSCHTARVDRYVVEGHVPAADIKRLLAEKPLALGLSVPGMPIGSPGMEIAGQPAEAYTVWLFQNNGQRTLFAKHGG